MPVRDTSGQVECQLVPTPVPGEGCDRLAAEAGQFVACRRRLGPTLGDLGSQGGRVCRFLAVGKALKLDLRPGPEPRPGDLLDDQVCRSWISDHRTDQREKCDAPRRLATGCHQGVLYSIGAAAIVNPDVYLAPVVEARHL